MFFVNFFVNNTVLCEVILGATDDYRLQHLVMMAHRLLNGCWNCRLTVTKMIGLTTT